MYRIIDGREEVRGHGTRDMPIWGEVFRQPEAGQHDEEIRVIGRILAWSITSSPFRKSMR